MSYFDFLDDLYPDWHAKASCNGEDPALWFPDTLSPPESRRRATAEARRICKTCPVRHLCLADAKKHNDMHGVWGGQDFERPTRNTDVA